MRGDSEGSGESALPWIAFDKGSLEKNRKSLKRKNIVSCLLLATRDQRNSAIDKGIKPDDAPGIRCKRKDL
jgi:hypothetical protein